MRVRPIIGSRSFLAATGGQLSDADRTKLDSVEVGATDDQTPAEILAASRTVDGLGSGLDADLFDGRDSSAFVLTGSWRETLDSTRLDITSGTPVRRSTLGMSLWGCNDSTSSGVGSQIHIPADVTLINVDLWWVQQTTGAGNVRLSANAESFSNTSTVGSAASIYTGTVAAPGTAGVVTVTRMVTELAVTADAMWAVRFARAGSHAADTLTGELQVMAIVVTTPDVGPGTLDVAAMYTELN